MRLHILSDIHLEFATFKPPETDADIIVLAGDIDNNFRGIVWARENFPSKEIIYVPGNHEYYGTYRAEALIQMRETARKHHIHLLDNDVLELEGVRFIGSTLWTDFELFQEATRPVAIKQGQEFLNDFRVIREDMSSNFTPADSIKLHKNSLNWLISKLDERHAEKTVVITHHLPSARSVDEKFKTSLISACFASELDYLFGKMELWIHGHTHSSLDYKVNGTRVICNPRGYSTNRGQENIDFNPGLVIDI